ncbi:MULTISPECIES: hypothetical protein [Limnospira]|uniref:Uncharacterized protein n=1 Tax=Limnospira fusiformis PMC 851.14 TaxID=2219512 RepID=A0ABU9EP93_LIMFS
MATFIVLIFRFALFIRRSSVDKNTSALLRSALAIWVASYPENPSFTGSLRRFSAGFDYQMDD